MTTTAGPVVAEQPRYDRVVRFVTENPWAILPSTLDTIVEVIRLRISGERLTDEQLVARIGPRAQQPMGARLVGRVQVIPIHGVIAQRMNSFAAISGGTSTEQLAATIQQAVNDPAVGAIVLDVDSPGGSVFGIQELADAIHALRGRKPIVAVANPMAASAAMWIASQADQFSVTPSGEVGSIGVLAIHEDLSAAAEKAGVKVTYVSAGRFKAERQPFEPLTDAARANIQQRVDEYYDAFVSAVARGRGVTASEVRAGFGEGRMVSASVAKRVGMVDRIETLEAAVDRVGRNVALGGAVRASAGRTRAMEPMQPNADGTCDEGYELRDGMCHPKAAAAAPGASAAIASLNAQLAAQAAQLQAAEAKLAAVTEERRQQTVQSKTAALKIPAFRPFVQALYDLATRIGADAPKALVVLAEDKKLELNAEAIVDVFVAELNAKASLLFLESSLHEDVPTAQEDDASAEVDRRAKKYQAEHPGTDYKAAVHAVLNADQDLKGRYARA